MSDTLLMSVSSALKRSTLEEVGKQLGESDQAVSRGMELSTATVFEGLTRRVQDSESLRQVVDVASKTPANAVTSALSGGQLTNPNSPLISGGKRLLSSLFGNGQDAITNAIGRESGLRAGSIGTIMALGAQSILSVIGSRVRDEGMTASTLASFLQSEGPSFRNSLPASIQDVIMMAPKPVRTTTPVMGQPLETNPVVAQTVKKERSIWSWLLPLVAILILGLLWSMFRGRRAQAPTVTTPAPVAETPAPAPTPTPATPDLGAFVPRRLPDGTMLNIPERGVEGKLLAFIQDPNRHPDENTWFDFDRLLFDTGSATLQPQSGEQLNNISQILKAYPRVHLTIGGYTDNVGSPAQNLTLSQQRANNVMAALVGDGIAPNRLTAHGYGEEHPVADNTTDAGRALNRRISMRVTQK